MRLCGRQAKRSSGKKDEREPLPRAYTVLCRFIYPNLSVRLSFLHGFYPVFSLFRTENCEFFCGFSTIFFAALKIYADNVHREKPGIGAVF
jgi:hypothetical protein